MTRHVKKSATKRFHVSKNFLFNLDSPKSLNLEDNKVTVEGWIVSKKLEKFEIQIKNGTKKYTPKMAIKRPDVEKSLGEKYGKNSLYSGFRAEFEYQDGEIHIEVRQGRSWRRLKTLKVYYGVEKTPKFYYNKNLAWNYAEHQNLLEVRKQYFYQEAGTETVTLSKKDPRLIAIYLPQFHPFRENDEAWGVGFTEWTNVTTASPRFIGHQQPILPSDLGFYDLRMASKMAEQIALAKKHGIYGFSFYYYWFSGKKVMDTPLNIFLENKNWDFNFSICWANENWTKRWDGRDNDIILAQEYNEDDPLKFIQDVEHILNDPRYITEDGKPVLSVYRPSELKDPEKYVRVWREYFRKKYNKELYLVSYLSFDDTDPRTYGFDAAVDFAPMSAFFKNKYFEGGQYPFVNTDDKLLDINFDGMVADYRSIALNKKLISPYDFPTIPCVTPSWDNDARKKGKGFVYTNSSTELYGHWLDNVLSQTNPKQKSPLVYINAWNEWAEGAMMEPSRHLGHATLNETSRVLKKYLSGTKSSAIKATRLAVIVHLYYTDTWNIIKKHLELIEQPFDLFLTLSHSERDISISLDNKDVKITKIVVPNRGRDVLPFLHVLRKVEQSGVYDKVLKLHSKKTTHREDGKDWFEELISGLLNNPSLINDTITKLNDPKVSLIGPKNHIVSLSRHMGSNRPILEHLLVRSYGRTEATKIIKNVEEYPFFGGTMFWARLDALTPLLDLYLMPDDFQSEHGQVDGTLAHAIERYLGVIGQRDGRIMFSVDADGIKQINGKKYTQKYQYAE